MADEAGKETGNMDADVKATEPKAGGGSTNPNLNLNGNLVGSTISVPDITISAPSAQTSPTEESGDSLTDDAPQQNTDNAPQDIESSQEEHHAQNDESKTIDEKLISVKNKLIQDVTENEDVESEGEDNTDDGNKDIEDDEEGEEDSDKEIEEIPYPGMRVKRDPNPELPQTVTSLETPDGCKVYVVGTAHFSHSSQDDVAKTIEVTQPDVVMVELCSSRVNILQLDEETLLEEAKNINLEKMRTAIRQSGMVQGILHLLLLNMSAHLTKQLGMAPGGEFRRAFREAQKIPGCRIQLGDRPIQITLRRALGSLSWWQKVRLAYYMITSKDPINAEEVEKCKQKDLLEEMLREMTGEFPALSQVFVSERDVFLANSLRIAAQPIPDPHSETGYIGSVVVGVVGIGHVQGIVDNWGKPCDIRSILRVPPPSRFARVTKWTIRAGLVALLSWGCYRVCYKLFNVGASMLPAAYRPAALTS